MLNTTAKYRRLMSQTHTFSVRVKINGKVVEETDIYSMRVHKQLFDSSPAVGIVSNGEISLDIIKPDFAIPKMAKIEPQYKVVGSDGTESAWMPKGVYYIDTRETTVSPTDDGEGDNLRHLVIRGLDAMLRTGKEYKGTGLSFPAKIIDVIIDILRVSSFDVVSNTDIDRTSLNIFDDNSTIPSIPEYYTAREILGFIAGMYGGSFVMSDDGKFRFIKIYELMQS